MPKWIFQKTSGDQQGEVRQKFVFLVECVMVKLLIYHTGMCIKGPESWWIAKSITISRVVNQSKVNPQRPKGVVD